MKLINVDLLESHKQTADKCDGCKFLVEATHNGTPLEKLTTDQWKEYYSILAGAVVICRECISAENYHDHFSAIYGPEISTWGHDDIEKYRTSVTQARVEVEAAG